MRRELLAVLPQLAHRYGIRPWEVERLTYDELQAFLDALKACPPVGGTVGYQLR